MLPPTSLSLVSPSKSFPFRTAPRVGPSTASVDATIAQLIAGDEPSRTSIQILLSCADDRGHLALLNAPTELLLPHELHYLTELELGRAQSEGALWTTVLDVIFRRHVIDYADNKTSVGLLPSQRDRLQNLLSKSERWIARRPWKSAIGLAAFTTAGIHEALCCWSAEMPVEWTACLIRRTPSALQYAASSVYLSPALTRRLAHIVMTDDTLGVTDALRIAAISIMGRRLILPLNTCARAVASAALVNPEEYGLPIDVVNGRLGSVVLNSLLKTPEYPGILEDLHTLHCHGTPAVREAVLSVLARFTPEEQSPSAEASLAVA